jgi:Zn ribbon nucleic-acid-binding protein
LATLITGAICPECRTYIPYVITSEAVFILHCKNCGFREIEQITEDKEKNNNG